mmetsp:Transcript_1879/g.4743  ORF Transcript_1879/g.4743 Transcript_1879/m.4743 type:complete len:324 (-) Transcript_1879:125-1096(-)
MRAFLPLVLTLALLATLAVPTDAKKLKKKAKSGPPAPLAASKLARYIECGVCEAFAENLHAQAMAVMEEKGGRKKTGEEPLLEIIEAICDAKEEKGEWLMGYDVVGEKGLLQVVKQAGFMDCGLECQAMQIACDEVRTNVGGSDLSEKIYKGQYTNSKAEFKSALCFKLSESCVSPKELKTPRLEVPFVPMSEQKWEGAKFQKKMKAMGMGGKMYDKDSLANMMGEDGEGFPPGMDGMDGMDGMGMRPDDSGEPGESEYEPHHAPPSEASTDTLTMVADGVSAAAKAVATEFTESAEALSAGVVDTIRQGVEYFSGKTKDKEL